jgi:hypothetical protein
MDEAAERFTSMAGVVHILCNHLDKYNIPDREYLSVNICKMCEMDILDTAPRATLLHTYPDGLTTFMGIIVNRNIPPIHCIICRGKNG